MVVRFIQVVMVQWLQWLKWRVEGKTYAVQKDIAGCFDMFEVLLFRYFVKLCLQVIECLFLAALFSPPSLYNLNLVAGEFWSYEHVSKSSDTRNCRVREHDDQGAITCVSCAEHSSSVPGRKDFEARQHHEHNIDKCDLPGYISLSVNAVRFTEV